MKRNVGHLILILFFTLRCGFTTAQNLVPNPSFEQYTECPQNPGGNGDFEFASPWLRSSGSPDFFNICSSETNGLSVPSNLWGNQFAMSGNAYAGIYVFNSTLPPFPPEFTTAPNGREYISVRLIHGLELGKRYFVRFFVSLADVSGYAVSSLGVYFSNQLITSLPGYIPQTPQVNNKPNTPITKKDNWVAIEDTITATGMEEYLMIGNFLHDTLCDTLFIGNQDTWNYASYYYIDDVLVVDVDSLEFLTTNVKGSKKEMLKTKVQVFPNPIQKYVSIKVTKSQLNGAEFIITDLLGRTIAKQTLLQELTTFSTQDWANGMYVWSMLEDGRLVQSGKLVKE